MSFSLKLQALGYPKAQEFDAQNTVAVRVLIAWLEDEKIRKLEPSARGTLRAVQSATWNQALKSYLTQLEAPEWFLDNDTLSSPAMTPMIVEFVLGRAVADEYSDRAKVYSAAATKATTFATASVADQLGLETPETKSGEASAPAVSSTEDAASRRILADALNPLCEIMELPQIRDDTPDGDIRAISRELRRRIQNDVLPYMLVQAAASSDEASEEATGQVRSAAAANKNDKRFRKFAEEVFVKDSTRRQRKALSAAAKKATSLLSRTEALQALQNTPLGQPTTGVERVDNAVRALRLIYVQDLRDLQRTVNDLLEVSQEFTANPQTNADLGTVGR